MTPLEAASMAYENERALWRIRYDHAAKLSIIMRGDTAIASYSNPGAALYAMQDARGRAGMREALMQLQEKLPSLNPAATILEWIKEEEQ